MFVIKGKKLQILPFYCSVIIYHLSIESFQVAYNFHENSTDNSYLSIFKARGSG